MNAPSRSAARRVAVAVAALALLAGCHTPRAERVVNQQFGPPGVDESHWTAKTGQKTLGVVDWLAAGMAESLRQYGPQPD